MSTKKSVDRKTTKKLHRRKGKSGMRVRRKFEKFRK